MFYAEPTFSKSWASCSCASDVPSAAETFCSSSTEFIMVMMLLPLLLLLRLLCFVAVERGEIRGAFCLGDELRSVARLVE